MSIFGKLFKKKPLSNYKVDTIYSFTDDVRPIQFIPNNFISDKIFEGNYLLYNYKYLPENKEYLVVVTKLNKFYN